MKNKITSFVVFISVFLGLSNFTYATAYNIPSNGTTVIGHAQYLPSQEGETLVSIAEKHDLGLNGILSANKTIIPTVGLPADVPILIPTSYILPQFPHKGIVINLPEMRMYYYPAPDVVMTFPIGIGRIGKTIPITKTAVLRKAKDPVWIPPEDIRAFNLEQGIVLPKVMPAGPDNPLGPFAIYLHIPTYLIHSTIFPDSVGRRASFGCIRMYEKDIRELFPLVTAGLPVTIIDQPTKTGWHGNYLFLETHEPLEENSNLPHSTRTAIYQSVANSLGNNIAIIDWQLVNYLSEERDGIPHEIGFKVS